MIPRTKLPETLRRIEAISREYRLEIGNIFHAGDGNLHPLILFDERDADQTRACSVCGGRISCAFCIAMGGALTGEHGIGMEKNELMPLVYSGSDLELMARVRARLIPRDF